MASSRKRLMLTEKELNEIISNWESASDMSDIDDGVSSSSSEREPEHEVDADNNMTQIQLEESPERRILVLGLENAGKSTILSQVTSANCHNHDVKPTEGFNVTSLHNGETSLNIWEVGGREPFRKYWVNFLQDTDLLVFVVDAADTHNLSLAVTEVKRLLGDDRMAKVPILVLANKQDKVGALVPSDVADALDLNSIPPSSHKVRVLGTQTPPGATERHPSIAEVENMLLLMCDK
uniref:Uncharacterized protein n=1 Tax=Timema douglasi TaxID=61478 RepID=A0A7R8VCQ9_TIMDO|nr:unnamed protein product [Timema douglasi]